MRSSRRRLGQEAALRRKILHRVASREDLQLREGVSDCSGCQWKVKLTVCEPPIVSGVQNDHTAVVVIQDRMRAEGDTAGEHAGQVHTACAQKQLLGVVQNCEHRDLRSEELLAARDDGAEDGVVLHRLCEHSKRMMEYMARGGGG